MRCIESFRIYSCISTHDHYEPPIRRRRYNWVFEWQSFLVFGDQGAGRPLPYEVYAIFATCVYINSLLVQIFLLDVHTARHLRAEGGGEQVAAYRDEVFASVLQGFQVLFIDAKGSGASIQGQRCSGSAYFLFILAAVKQGRSSATLGSNIVELSASFTIIHLKVVPYHLV